MSKTMKWENEDGILVSTTPAGNRVEIHPDRQYWRFYVDAPEGMVESRWWHSLEACKGAVPVWSAQFGPARWLKSGTLRALTGVNAKMDALPEDVLAVAKKIRGVDGDGETVICEVP